MNNTTHNIVELIEQQVIQTPDSIALVTGKLQINYRELSTRISQLSQVLKTLNLEPEQPVAVLMPRNVDMVVLLLALLKAGVAYVPLEPEDPPARHLKMLESIECNFIICEKQLNSTLPEQFVKQDFAAEARVVYFHQLHGAPKNEVEETGSIACGGQNLAYILFTSGSTGVPKGVAVEHCHAVNLLLAAKKLLDFTEQDRLLSTSTIAFDLSIIELYLPLICGATIVLGGRDLLLDPSRLTDQIIQHKITVYNAVPSVWATILKVRPDFPKLRRTISTGDAIGPSLALKLLPYGEQVWNLYGPTETTVWACGTLIDEQRCLAMNPDSFSIEIGKPLANTHIYVFNEQMQAVAEGKSGELWIGGSSVTRGYYKHDALTHARFLAHPQTGDRLYRTGDRVTLGLDNDIQFLGRIDDQLQIHGVRIEPREVEAAIIAHPEVLDVAATWFHTAFNERSIVVAVVPKSGKKLNGEQLTLWLKDHLPVSLIPAKYLFRTEITLNTSGKVDRKFIRALAERSSEEQSLPKRFRPLNFYEDVLTRIWQRLLNMDIIDPDQHFFTIGGDSLLAVRMVHEVENEFNITLTVQAVYKNPTLEKLAEYIEKIHIKDDKVSFSSYVLQLTEGKGNERPVFFNNVDLSLAARGKWNISAPLYSISHWAHGEGFKQVKTLSELAAQQIVEIKQIQAVGPYRLGGYSFGGLVAYEIASLLQSQGEEVEALFLLEPMAPLNTNVDGQAVTNNKLALDGKTPLKQHLFYLKENPKHVYSYVLPRIISSLQSNRWVHKLIYHIVHLNARHRNPVSSYLLPKNRWPAFNYAARKLTSSYTAYPYHGRVKIIYTNRGIGYEIWQTLVGKEALITIPEVGHHDLFSEPIYSQWFSQLKTMLTSI